jgi:hypothetical protein
MKEFIRGYLEAALFASHDINDPEYGDTLDAVYSVDDFSDKAREDIKQDCESFIEMAEESGLWDAIEGDLAYAGHNFFLTRNRHGAGFWDGRYESKIGNELTKIAHTFGSQDFYVNDNSEIEIA